MLLGQNITVWTDHRNLTYKNTEHASDRVLRQRLLLEEYAVNLKFIQGIKNVAADMLSRNDLIFEPTKKVSTEKFEELVHEVHSTEMIVPVDYEVIAVHQASDKELYEFRTSKDTTGNYKMCDFGKTCLWTKKGQDGQDKIWLPSSLRKNPSGMVSRYPSTSWIKEVRGECSGKFHMSRNRKSVQRNNR